MLELKHFVRMWREALPEDRWIAGFLFAYASVVIALAAVIYRWG